MNAKLCKKLRKLAHHMHQPDKVPVRKLMVHPAHEARAKQDGFLHVTAVNHPQSWRGIYRWLKRNYAHA